MQESENSRQHHLLMRVCPLNTLVGGVHYFLYNLEMCFKDALNGSVPSCCLNTIC